MNYNTYLGYILPPIKKGQANGVASLNGSTKIPAEQLPSYVDDVLEYDTYQDFPVSGETGKIYLDKQTGATYRWTGSNFFKITSGLTNLVNGSATGSVRSVGSKEEDSNYTIGSYAFAENFGTIASGNLSHAEGQTTTASGPISHAEGANTTASGDLSHAEGGNTTASGSISHAEGQGTTASGAVSHAEGGNTTASGTESHAEGEYTEAIGNCSHAEGCHTTASKNYSHAEGLYTTASKPAAHAEGYQTTASGDYSHAEGGDTTASGNLSHAEGGNTEASGTESHAEGDNTTASGSMSHAEGYNTTASGAESHAEGQSTTASGPVSHAEGDNTTASGRISHAEGQSTTASGSISHTEGLGTIANHKSQHVFGQYNVADPSAATPDARGTYIEIVGNGTAVNAKSNARTLDWSGNEKLAGSLTLGMGTNNETTITAIQLKSIIEESDIESITYNNLVTKRNNHTLVPNKKYRLTDYECTTTQNESRVISHPFDIILTAYNESILLEKASACLRDGDTYYSSHSNSLELWEVHYCLDNDTNRFEWADSTNGKGVIYYLKDDKGNEAPYDFKQIQFKRYQVTQCSTLSNLVGTYVHANYNTNIIQAVDTNNPLWCYTFSIYTNNEIQDKSIYEMYNIKGHCYNNIINTYINNDKILLNNIVFLNNDPAAKRSCQNNFFAYNCYNFSFNDNCNTNNFGDNNYDIILLGGCYTNTFGNKCDHIILNADCSYITGKTQCRYIIVEEFNNQINFNNNFPHTVYGSNNNPITTYIGKNTNNELKIWQPANLV